MISVDKLAVERLKFYGSWCPYQQSTFCQNREGCADCCIKEETDQAAMAALSRIVAVLQDKSSDRPPVPVAIKPVQPAVLIPPVNGSP